MLYPVFHDFSFTETKVSTFDNSSNTGLNLGKDPSIQQVSDFPTYEVQFPIFVNIFKLLPVG